MERIESEVLELKRQFTDEIKKTVIAFANDKGGEIYIGIKDDGEVVGVENIDEVVLKVASSIRNAIKPDISMFVSVGVQEIEKKPVVVINVQRGTAAPYYLAEKGLKPSGVFVRLGSSTVMASEEHIRKMIKESDGDRYIHGRSFIQELTFEAAQKAFQKSNVDFGDSEKRTLGIVRNDGEYSNLALLISDQCRHTIKTAVFEGTTKTIFRDRREFGGSLFLQLEDVFNYIDLHNKVNADFRGLKRIDKRDYPILAVREALLNAIVHREYAFSGSILVNLFEDRLEVVSIGGIVFGLTLDGIKNGISQSRNDMLANIFYRLGFIEAYGTGIPRIMDAYKHSASKPTISATVDSFAITLPKWALETSKPQTTQEDDIKTKNDIKDDIKTKDDINTNDDINTKKDINIKDNINTNDDINTKDDINAKDDINTKNDINTSVKEFSKQEILVLELVKAKGKITRLELMDKLNIGATRSHNILSKMVKENKLIENRNGRIIEYFLPR